MFPDVVMWFIPIFVIAIVGEVMLISRRQQQYDIKDAVTSISMGAGHQLVALGFGTAMVLFFYQWTYDYRLLADMPITLLSVLTCFFADDFFYYWFHRVSHERRWFWASHIVHHSSQKYNLSTALRQTWTGKVSFTFIFSLPLLLIGFPPEMVLFVAGINLVYQFWIHTELVDTLGPLELVLNTPSHHRVHHATNPRYLDANYGGVLIVWDRLFGTFVAERRDEPPEYGIVKNIETFNPFKVAFHEWFAIAKDVVQAKSLGQVLAYLFGPPGWSPDGSRMTSRMIKQQWRNEQDDKP